MQWIAAQHEELTVGTQVEGVGEAIGQGEETDDADDVPDVIVGETSITKRFGVGRTDLLRRACQPHGVVEEDPAAIVERRLAPVGGNEIGDLRILVTDSQDRPVSDDAVRAVVRRRRGDGDQLAVGLRQRRRVLVHDEVVELEERPEQPRPLGEQREHVGHEPGFLGDLGDASLDVCVVLHETDANSAVCVSVYDLGGRVR